MPKLNLTDSECLALRDLNRALLQCARTGAIDKLELYCSKPDTVDDLTQALEALALVAQSE